MILPLLVFFPLSNFLSRTVFLFFLQSFWYEKYQSKEGTFRNPFSKLVNQLQPYQQTDLHISSIWYIYLLLLRQIDARDGDIVQPVDTILSAPFIMECVLKYSTLMPIYLNSGRWVCTTSLNILLTGSYWELPSNNFLCTVRI